MLRTALVAILSFGCSSASFDVANTTGTDGDVADTSTSATDSSVPTTDSTVVEDSGMVISTDSGMMLDMGVDTRPTMTDAPTCPGLTASSTDVYVNSSAAPGGKGTITCPFRTIGEAAATPLGTGVTRTVHIQVGTYNEAGAIKIRAREIYRSEGGTVRVSVPGSAPACATGTPCAMQMEPGSTLDGFLLDGGGVAQGLVVAGAGTPAARVMNVTVRTMTGDGIVVTAVGITAGPNVYSNLNGGDGLRCTGGKVFINEGPNGFNNNMAAGIHMVGGSIFLDNIATASSNNIGVLFDKAGFSSNDQTLSQIDIVSNKTHGIVIGKDWAQVMLRKVNVNSNVQVGVWAEFNDAMTNLFDFGSSGDGKNIFATPSTKNGKAGLFLCHAPAAYTANGNTWSSCPPSAASNASCTVPTVYADFVYQPGTTVMSNPLTTMSCTASG
jgi:hypothetical protein